MKISLNWLKRYIDIDIPVDKLSEILTDIGLEVEGTEVFEPIKGSLKGIVVGEIIEAVKHPNADKLSLTKVDIGGDENLQIVCGAPNVAKGQKILVATIGTSLYDEEEKEWKIKKGKIRGELSEGMICSEIELGLGEDHSGIMVLPEDVKSGTLAKDYFNINNDYVFDIGLTPNRSDATSHLGVAKDLAAYFRINEDWTGSIKLPELSLFKIDLNSDEVSVIVEDDQRCPRYSGVCISGIQIKSSPEWMQSLLKAVGVRPINNIVDITNFVLHELGQPLHAFDKVKISDNTIRVKTLSQNTPFVSLDEQERKLHNEDLMICDGQNSPLCIGGVFGGLNSGVTDRTEGIFLEAAHFNASSIRKSSTRHLLRTDAAKIFEKGSDPNGTIVALKRAALLMKEYANAEITSEIVDVYPNIIEPKEILLVYDKVCKHIGNDLDKEEIHNILRAMKMELKPVDENSVLVRVTTDKADVIRDVDLIEEILRIYGFNKVKIPSKLSTTITHKDHPSKRSAQNMISDFLSSNGFNEMMGISLIESSKYEEELHKNLVFINNTSNIHLDIMRPDALVSGLKSVAQNINHQQTDLKLYEFGRTYCRNGEFSESEFLSLFITGKHKSESWKNHGNNDSDFYDLKGWINEVLAKVNLQGYSADEIIDDPDFEYGLSYFSGNQKVGQFGLLSKLSLSKVGISQDVYYAILDFKALYLSCKKGQTETTEISKYPSVRRDLALVINDDIAFNKIKDITLKTDKKILKDIGLFDVYKNEKQLGKGKKSYAIKFVFQDDKRTLKDKDVEKVMNKLVKAFENELEAQIRT